MISKMPNGDNKTESCKANALDFNPHSLKGFLNWNNDCNLINGQVIHNGSWPRLCNQELGSLMQCLHYRHDGQSDKSKSCFLSPSEPVHMTVVRNKGRYSTSFPFIFSGTAALNK